MLLYFVFRQHALSESHGIRGFLTRGNFVGVKLSAEDPLGHSKAEKTFQTLNYV